MGSEPDKRGQLLQRLRGQRFERIRFPGLDAVVVRVPGGTTSPPPFVQELVERRQPFRIYPVEGGAHLVKWARTGSKSLPEGHFIEPGGWDHEHCDGCDRHILTGRTFWQTASGPCFWLCPYCYRRLRQLE
jgi:hypothetical protein